MSLPEIPYRAANALRGQVRRYAARSRTTIDQVPVQFSSAGLRPETFLSHLQGRGTPSFYVDLDTQDSEAWAVLAMTERVKRVLDGQIDIGALSFRGMPPGWHADPTTNVAWPIIYQGDIRVRSRDEIGDVRAVWELNRMQWLFDLAICYRATGESCYAESIERVLDHWIASNPIDVGVNWISGMESAIRAQSWIWLAFLVCCSDRPRLSAILAHGIWSHLRHVEANLSRFSSANNHLIVEASTLFIAGVLLPEFESSARWQREGRRIIEQEVPRQVRPDGVSAEQSVHYHAFVLEALLLMALLAERNGIALNPVVVARIRGMLRFLAAVTDEEGRVPAIGDSDDGRVSPLSCQAESYYAYLLVLGNQFMDSTSAGHSSARARWVVGERSSASDPATTQDRLTLTEFADSGYVAIHDTTSSRRITFDAGPHGLERLYAHAHADALSVTLAMGGIDVLADPGTCVYNVLRPQRDWLRSTAAHSTVEVDGRSQSEPAGPFVWITKTDGVLEHSTAESWFAFASGHHDGYAPVRHTRMVLVADDMLVVADRLDGDPAVHSYRHSFTLGAGIRPRAVDGGWVLDHNAKPMASLLMSPWPGQSLESSFITSSTRFLEAHDTEQLSATAEAEGEFRTISVCHTGCHSPALLERSEGLLVFETAGRRCYVATGVYHSEHVHFEGELLYLYCTAEGEVDRLFAHGCSTLSVGGQDLKHHIAGRHRQVTVN